MSHISPRTLLPVLALLLLVGLLPAADNAKKKSEPLKPAQIAANLAKIPASDPAPANAPAVVTALAGQHPRLLFTVAELAALQAKAEGDALLKAAIADVIKTAGMYPFGKGQPDVVQSDTPAIWKAGGTYPGLAYAWHLSKDAKIKAKIVQILTAMLAEPHWSLGGELDSSMGAGNCMLMVGVLFDAVASDLDAELRGKLAAKILTHARRLWYLGHQEKAIGTTKYWQQDPQNNHRWHRNAGLAACLLAIADEPGLETGYMLEQLKGEMDFVVKWLPHDGDCHEGAGYQGFGFMHLALATRMMDRVLGTAYQKSTALHNAWSQQIFWWAPGSNGNMSFGDDNNSSGGGFDYKDAAFFVGPQLSRDKDAQAALVFRLEALRQEKPGDLPWTLLPFYDPALAGGDSRKLPTRKLLIDLGAASMRDAWQPDAVALTFKCGPYGGHKLNAFANHTGKQTYINVAHDDPDANSFALGMAGDLIFHPGHYAMPKLTESGSTILVDGKGQVNEGSGYTQPVKGVDMRTLAYLTGWKEGEAGRTIVEGEAGASYQGQLTRFRRTAIYLPGDYILLLDDLAADQPRTLTWVGATPKGALVDAAAGTATATGAKGKTVPFQVVADAPLQAGIKALAAPGRRGPLDLQQVRFTAQAAQLRLVCVLDPWNRQAKVELKNDTITVTCGGTVDTWTWQRAADARTPSVIDGKRGGQALLALTAKDAPPQP